MEHSYRQNNPNKQFRRNDKDTDQNNSKSKIKRLVMSWIYILIGSYATLWIIGIISTNRYDGGWNSALWSHYVVSEDSKFGLAKKQQILGVTIYNEVIPCLYDQVCVLTPVQPSQSRTFGYHPSQLPVIIGQHNKYALCSIEGDFYSDFIYDKTGSLYATFSKDYDINRGNYQFDFFLLPVSKDGKWGIIDNKGIIVLPVIYDEVTITNDTTVNYRQGRMWTSVYVLDLYNNRGK